MADNFLERQYDDYLRQKAAKERQKRIKWQKQLQAYKEKLKAKDNPADQDRAGT